MPQCSVFANRIERTCEVLKKSGLMRLLPSPLKQEVNTRWNTIYLLLESVMKNFDEIEHILNNKNELYRMAGIEKKLVEELVSFLEVFKTASLEMEATKKNRRCTYRFHGTIR
jgi:hypothetical protein